MRILKDTVRPELARIKRELGIDLQDPDERLRLQILLKAMQIQEAMQSGTT